MGRTLVEHIAQMLLLARPTGEGGAPPPRPWFPPALLVASAYSLCGQSSLEENRRALWDKVGPLGGRAHFVMLRRLLWRPACGGAALQASKPSHQGMLSKPSHHGLLNTTSLTPFRTLHCPPGAEP